MCAISIFTHVKVLLATFTVGSISVGRTIDTMTAMSSQVVEVTIEVTLVRVAVAVTWLALVRALRSSSTPWRVVIERQTLFAIWPVGVVLALANLLSFSIQSGTVNAPVGVSITFASSTDSNISNGVEVRLQHLFVAKQFITESIQTSQGDSDVSCCDPILELNAVLEVVGAGASFQR